VRALFSVLGAISIGGVVATACGGGDDGAGGTPSPGHDASVSGDGALAADGAPLGGDGAPSTDAGPRDAPAGGDAADASTPHGPAVVFASGYGADLNVFSVDPATGALAPTSSVAAGDPSPSFLAVRPGGAHLYAVGESAAGRVGAYAIDRKTGALSYLGGVSSQGNGPAFVSVDHTGAWAMVANYGDGTTAVFPIGADGKLGAPSDTRNVGANAHMIVTDPSNKFVFVPCLGADYVAQFTFDAATGKLTPNTPAHVATAAGAGPRHIAFHPGGAHAYLLNETASTITSFALDAATGKLSELDTTTTLPAGFTGTNTGAEVWVHPSGKFVYTSNRGDDSIAVFAVDPATFKLTATAHTKTGGTTPRSFGLDPTGAYLYAANQGSGTLTTFAVDPAQGTLTKGAGSAAVPSASFVGVVWLPGP
jgi:6-phosphogluconolactonase